ncbi:MAG: peptide chain release factor 1 [Lachnospiraceae bacterium]|nr:peptide chain release factor 1 [Lachnospiraceae bacterium]
MFEKLESLSVRLKEIVAQLTDPSIAGDSQTMTALLKEQASLAPIAEAYEKYKKVIQDKNDSLLLLEDEKDEEMRAMLKEEFESDAEKEEALAHQLQLLLLPRDPDEGRDVIVEIRAGTGGDEAALFAADLYRMYTRYADRRGWRYEMLSFNESGLGGFRECVFQVSGKDAYSRLQFEGGIHRVQRIPVTESGGRIQTSTATVAVLPEAEEADVTIDPRDIRFDVFRASGNGGQCVNTTDSAVRLVHIPTGIVISCQDEKSQLKNRSKAMKVLRAMLYQKKKDELHEERADLRRMQVGSGDRSEKIRTYNFSQGRVTDHRIHLTLHKIDSIIDGDLDELIDALTLDMRERQLKEEERNSV